MENENKNINDIFSNFGKTSSSSSFDSFDFYDILNSIASKSSSSAVNDPSGECSLNEDPYDWKSAYDSVVSDFASFRKRIEIQKSTEKKNLTKEIIRGFLEIIDYILYTFKAKDRMGTYSKEDEMILNRLFSFLEKYGVRPIKGIDGKPFDHNLCEAILVDKSGMFEDGTVTMVVNQGYMIGDEVLRHAKVCVSGSPD